MKIGALAKQTGVPTRMLRYYEEQGLITPHRLPNGYRDYDERHVARVHQVRDLLDAGVPTRIISAMLPCLHQPGTIVVENADPVLRNMLVAQRDRMGQRLAVLERNRDALTRYIDAMDAAAGRPVDDA